jgi:putative FmdB family regulatory protein
MPLHEYNCRSCGHRFEALVRGTDQPVCPSCRGTDLEKLLSLFAVDSETTRQNNLQAGRKLLRNEHRDRAVAEREAIEHHHE